MLGWESGKAKELQDACPTLVVYLTSKQPTNTTEGDTSIWHMWQRARTVRFLFPQLSICNQILLEVIKAVYVELSWDKRWLVTWFTITGLRLL